MNWTRSEVIALAHNRCTICHGLGLRAGRNGKTPPCNCVFRAIFRACHNRFRSIAACPPRMTTARLEGSLRSHLRRGQTFGFRNEEYAADFLLVARRVLRERTLAWNVFRWYHLYGGDWKLVTRKLGLDRGAFFHEVYRVEQRLGRAFRELTPYSLFPLDEYFGGAVRGVRPAHPIFAVEAEAEQPAVARLRFPIRGAAA